MATLSIPTSIPTGPTATPAGLNRERALKALASLPPFTPVLNKLLATLSSEDASIKEIAAIIEKDIVIAGNILKLVNSAMYGRRGVVTNLAHASMLLGLSRLRNAVLGMSLTRYWNQVKTPPLWSTSRFNLHSIGTALLADMLAQRVETDFAEGAFLGGLFHDVGKLLIVVGCPAEYQQVTILYNQGALPWLDCEKEVLGIAHPELSEGAVNQWKVPDPIRVAVRDHHIAGEDPDVPGRPYRLATILRCANLCSNAAGISVLKDRSAAEVSLEEPLSLLALQNQSAEIMEEFKAQYSALTAFFH